MYFVFLFYSSLFCQTVGYLLQTRFKACTELLVHRTFFHLFGVTLYFEVIIGIAIWIYLAQFNFLFPVVGYRNGGCTSFDVVYL